MVTQSLLSKLTVAFLSLVILTTLLLQIAVGICCHGSHADISLGKILCAPSLWPFLDYPMYSWPHFKDDKVTRYFVVGITESSGEVVIKPEDFGLSFWPFIRNYVDKMIKGDKQTAWECANLYTTRFNQKLTGLRLENRPIQLTDDGVQQAPIEIINIFQLTLEADDNGGQSVE